MVLSVRSTMSSTSILNSLFQKGMQFVMAAAILLAICVLAPTPLLAQETVLFDETGIAVELPESWSATRTWSLTDNLPAVALHHIQNEQTGQRVAVHREQCEDEQRRLAWASGELSNTHLDHRVDSLTPIVASEDSVLGDSRGYMSLATHNAMSFKSYAFFLVRGKSCYLVEVGGPETLFEASQSTYREMLEGVVLPAQP